MVISYYKYFWFWVSVVLIAFVGWYFWSRADNTVTVMSQTEAETKEGLQLAANNARVLVLASQLKEAQKQIVGFKNKEPEYIVKTVVQEVPFKIEEALKRSGADFAVVSNPDEPDKQADLTKLTKNTTVNLNQYNVQAYRKVIRQIDYVPKSISTPSPRELGYTLSKKVTENGQYIGFGVGYDFEDKRAKVMLRYTW